jgi:hypothetical protein
MYTSVMLFGVNEVAPREEYELALISIFMLISAMFNAVVFGTMAVLVQEISKKTIEFQDKLDTANTAMKNL